MKIRIYSSENLGAGSLIDLTREQGNYLGSVLRMKEGQELFVFNASDGEFSAKFISKKQIELGRQTQKPEVEQQIILLFAPVKFGKIDILAQKATELGATVLQPVETKHTHISRINYDRLKANAIEAAEQTGRISTPEVKESQKLLKIIGEWNKDIKIIFCDDSLEAKPIAEALQNLSKGNYAVLVGPEGGFSEEETAMLKKKDFVIPVTMGKRLLRAETAALAALAVFQAVSGDWK
jgi:16S rRNA (uracil1498-N3)-methyltransferase